MKAEDKYKDFQDLPDPINEQTLIDLFIKRNYVHQGFDNHKANDIIISKDITDGKIEGKFVYNPSDKTSFKASTYDERMVFWKELLTGGLRFPENFEIEQAKWEISYLYPEEIKDRYLRKVVEAYLQICRNIIKENVEPSADVKFVIMGINISSLTDDLQKRKFFDKSYHKSVLNWFNGLPPESPIPMNKSANIFISLIADLIDQEYIQNTKKFCHTYIADSFRFKGKKVETTYVSKVMRPNNENRVSSRDRTIPNIQIFTTYI